jgi:hypothetical protein
MDTASETFADCRFRFTGASSLKQGSAMAARRQLAIESEPSRSALVARILALLLFLAGDSIQAAHDAQI